MQALGSIGAIFGAAWIAVHQSKLQHRNALELHKTEKRSARLEVAKTLLTLSANSAKVTNYIADQLNTRQSIHDVAEGLVHCDIGEVERINGYIGAIPLHSIPDSLVTPTMLLGSTVRQFKDKVDMVLRLHRQMDGKMFDDFFRTLSEMNVSIRATHKDIEKQVKRLDSGPGH